MLEFRCRRPTSLRTCRSAGIRVLPGTQCWSCTSPHRLWHVPSLVARDGSENPPRRLTEAIAAIYRTGGLGAFYVGYGTMVPQLLAEWRNSAFSSRPPARPGDARDPPSRSSSSHSMRGPWATICFLPLAFERPWTVVNSSAGSRR